MNPITRYDPFTRGFDDLFKGMFLRPVRLDMDAMPELQIKLDITENGDAYQVSAELPGVNKEDIKVSVEGNLLRISAETKKETEEKKGDQVLRSERYYGRLERAVALDSDVDDGKVEARYADGVLKLKLPKKATSASRRITVS
jgi:HSP20 family protein